MACADAGSVDLHTREFSEWSKVNLRNTGGPAKRYEMWMAITSAMCEFAGLGMNRPLKDIIVCWTYTMTDEFCDKC